MIEYNLQRCINMREIELSTKDNIESTVYTLLAAKARGEHVWCSFNGHKLFSDNVTMDSAYQEITGKTKEEFDLMIRKSNEHFRNMLAESEKQSQQEAKLVAESKKESYTPITSQKVIAGLKFIAENQDVSQIELVKGLLDLGCNFTLDDIKAELPTTEENLFDGLSHGDIACGATVIANVRMNSVSRAFCDDNFLSIDNNTSVYNFIRVVTGDLTYTKEKITVKNNGPKLNKSLK